MIVDANVWMDLAARPRLMRRLWVLSRSVAMTGFVERELAPDIHRLVLRLGVGVLTLNALAMQRLVQLMSQHRALSAADVSCIVAAEAARVPILTGDAALRRVCEAYGIPVHGTLWVLDEMERGGHLGPGSLHRWLSDMLAAGRRLPQGACEERLRRWKACAGQRPRTGCN